MIIWYTKLGTMATEVKRKQVCKTDYNVSPGYENPGKEKSALSEWVGQMGPRTEGLALGSELSSEATGGGCLLRGKHWTGRSILRIRHSIREHDRMENWGTQLLVSQTKKYFFAQAYFMRSPSTFSQGILSCPLKNRRGWSEFQSFLSGRRPTWASQLPPSKMEGKGCGTDAFLSGSRPSWSNRKGTDQKAESPMGLMSGVLVQRKTWGNWDLMARTLGKSLNHSGPQSYNLPNENTYRTYYCELRTGITNILTITNVIIPTGPQPSPRKSPISTIPVLQAMC